MRRSWIAGLAGLALVALAIPGTAGAAPSGRAALAGSVPPWATSANFKQAADPSQYVGFRVYLGFQNMTGLQALASAVSTPSNASYRRFLTPAQFRAQFSPSQAQVNQVRSWLQDQGFSIDYVPANNHYIQAEGTVAQAAAAFSVNFGEYSVGGKTLRSPASNLVVPSSIAPLVSGVIGLDQSADLVRTNIADNSGTNAPPAPAFVTGQPCSAYWGQLQATGFPNPYGSGTLPYATCGYTPQQVKGAYGLANTGLDGSGQTVAIIDAFASPTIAQDANQWSQNRGLPQFQGHQFSQVVAPGTFHHPEAGNRHDPQNWYGEETLDVESVHGMAPGANVVYVGAANNEQDLDAALNYVVDNRVAQIVTNSYGFPTELLPTGFVVPQEQTLIQAAVEGIGVYFSSGDNSDESLVVGYQTPDWPASSPWVTAVGGTTLAVGASNNYLFETGWGTKSSTFANGGWSPTPPGNWIYGAGGGVSRLFAEPAYQQGVVPQGVFTAQGRTGRAVPDVSALADPNAGYIVGQTQTFPDGSVKYSEYRLGGTSLASPIFAGLMALADEHLGGAHGFADPAIYAASSSFTDVTSPASTIAVVRTNFVNGVDASSGLSYVLRTANQTLSLHTTPGYDDVTGVGTPNAALINLP